ncbi:hypothetical protein J6590_011520 [Homalodisca vitripennis]|nr:hypothetical protein J6590_011520 [Homalodisca vitripennis]
MNTSPAPSAALSKSSEISFGEIQSRSYLRRSNLHSKGVDGRSLLQIGLALHVKSGHGDSQVTASGVLSTFSLSRVSSNRSLYSVGFRSPDFRKDFETFTI